ncbi:hypothetical protein BdWA1_002755 [Babesia duncani]|uniref:Uncharacterized protein n=1 Tax=Babesia duncani TaxID=323732 RepID=A0AAD9PK37_9APIC|nr:hypothetical protein BdWA1_002755 [Babesia duncani]
MEDREASYSSFSNSWGHHRKPSYLFPGMQSRSTVFNDNSDNESSDNGYSSSVEYRMYGEGVGMCQYIQCE